MTARVLDGFSLELVEQGEAAGNPARYRLRVDLEEVLFACAGGPARS